MSAPVPPADTHVLGTAAPLGTEVAPPARQIRAMRAAGALLRRGLWLLPLATSLVFMLVVGFWAAGIEAHERQELTQRLQADAASVQAQLDARLDLERARLRDVALRLADAGEPAAVDLKALPEVIAGFDRLWNRLVWLDADLRVLARAERSTKPGSTPATEGLRIRSRGQADHLEQPVPPRAGGRAGELLARYELTDLLGSTDLAWLDGRYEVTFVSELGEVIATTARTGVPPQGLPLERPLPSFRDTALRLAPYVAPQAWYRSASTQAMLAALLAIGVAASLLLRREVGQVKQAEAAARTEAAWRRSMEDSALVGLRARDVEGRILYVNRTLCQMVGYGPEELVGCKPPLPFWPPESVDALMARNSTTLAGAAPVAGYETRWRHRDGRPLDVVIYESRLVDSEGRHIGWMGSIVDIGERKRLEDLERRHTEALAQHARLNDLGLIASELAHELNQPLSAIAGYSAGLKALMSARGQANDEVADAVDVVQRNARKAGEIVNWIRRRGARAAPAVEPCDLNALIDDVLHSRQRLMERLQVRVCLVLADGLPPVPADRIGIEQVLTNLLRNAAEAMSGATVSMQVEVGTSLLPATADAPAAVEVTVCDSGPGLQGRTLDQLCAAFYTTKRDGMGLGLGICRAIVEQHGGSLRAVDNPRGGACFAFSLPVCAQVPITEI